MSKEHPKVFLARAGRDGIDEELALDSGLAIIGFREVGSLDGITAYKDVFNRVATAFPDLGARAVGNYAGQLWNFAGVMRLGDIVVLPRKLTSQIALGRVTGDYRFETVGGESRHTRPVQWVRPDVPRSAFGRDLLASFGAFMTVCNITRNLAEQRVAAILDGKPDPSTDEGGEAMPPPMEPSDVSIWTRRDLAHDAAIEIFDHIQRTFKRHDLARLVEAILKAEGWVTKLSPPGPDGGVDILAGRGPLGLDAPRLCVQVKSQEDNVDVTVLRALVGSMDDFQAEQGLLVAWSDYTKPAKSLAHTKHFSVRLWKGLDVVDAIYRNYERLPADIRAELPLKQVWMLVPKDLE